MAEGDISYPDGAVLTCARYVNREFFLAYPYELQAKPTLACHLYWP
jgi:hypothetical protein